MLALIFLKILMILVDRIVGQVHIQVFEVAFVGFSIGYSSKPGQAILVDVDSQRIDSEQQDVYPQVILKAID